MTTCPVCNTEDAVRTKDNPTFYRDGRLMARCFHGNSHPNGGPVSFFIDSGELVSKVELSPAESLYQVSRDGTARGIGSAFLAKCGVYFITAEDAARSSSAIPTEKWLRGWQAAGVPVAVAPLYKGAQLVGLEVRAMQEKSSPRPGEPSPKSGDTRKTVGDAGIYIANASVQPVAVIAFAGIWDAISAAWDAYDNGTFDRYAFAAYSDGTNPQMLRDTLEAFFPGVPRLIVSDQDPSGQKTRTKFAKAGTVAILPGTGFAKDYRDANPKKRWAALLDGIERALDSGNPSPTKDAGIWKIFRRALQGALKAKSMGMRDLEAWRFGQRCGGMCRVNQGGRKYFGIRANLYGEMVTSEGQHDFEPILQHSTYQLIEQKHPDLAAVIRAGATEHHLSAQWRPPMFLEDGRHWSEVPPGERTRFARSNGWEPWTGKDPGIFLPTDMETVLDAMRGAYAFVRIPNAPDSEVGLRMTIWTLSTALCAMKAEETWGTGKPTGFLPWLWFYGGPTTGKGTALKIIAACLTGSLRTYGSQRFGGDKEYDWLTESVLHLPICFRDELDGYMKGANIEDLKTFLAGEALQLRKKFGTDMSISPRPVVIASNSLHINQEDEATQERITLVELQRNPLATKKELNNAFERFHAWLEGEGRGILYRLTLALYKEFRKTTIDKSSYSRSAMLDSAVTFLSRKLSVGPGEVFRPSTAGKDAAVLRNSPWYARLLEYTRNELGTKDTMSARMVDVWSLSLTDPNQKRTFYRYCESFSKCAAQSGGAVSVGNYYVKQNAFDSSSSTRAFIFERGDVYAIAQ